MRKLIFGLFFLAIFLAVSVWGVMASIRYTPLIAENKMTNSATSSDDEGGGQKPFARLCGDEGGPGKPFGTGP